MEILTFQPILKQIRWGGRRLGDLLNKPIGTAYDYAESWEICDLGETQSQVATGPAAGLTLRKLIEQQPHDFFASGKPHQFPLLIKYLDCHDRLSVQVHPNDVQARLIDPQAHGKTEAWVVMDAPAGSIIYAGFRPDVTRSDLEQAISSGTIETLLHQIHPQPGDCYFIPAGIVHALGEGVLIAEVQQVSDLTYRLFDWNRVDQQGKSRPLHIEQALSCLTFPQHPVLKQTPQLIDQQGDSTVELLVDCEHFRLLRYRVEQNELRLKIANCQIFLGLAGSAEVRTATQTQELKPGSCCLLPRTLSAVEINNQATTAAEILAAEVSI